MSKNNTDYHNPVMLQECLDGLNIRPDGIYVDVTFGGGGHSRAIFNQLSSKGILVAFDQDVEAKDNVWETKNFHFIESNFSFLRNQLKLRGITKVDGILADLGVSSHQFDKGDRGFSIRSNTPLDMRMNQKAQVSAINIVNNYEVNEIARVLGQYGELKNAGRIARGIVSFRSNKKIETTGDLMDATRPFAPKFKDHKFFAQVFQGIRIEVNDEMKTLENFLLQTREVLAPGGRLVVMSYHSLEDRPVKNYMKRGSIDGTIDKDFFGNILKPFTEINRHPIEASEVEKETNNRARSAKLRIAERNNGE
ncbi:16S rRNA (cytosine(1402)-N(4))-methyltransferase RsmH [Crocinitomicaceae bacterium]|jgi:16S rRNA (cytosine1402-N4)-methyltransferase|nr:16S rRNA (cytosine(1402)-N(4))-methyltransferase RsmH [Crocinitomicaceae bacterium]MDG1346858.1 16S rRNA (cytosine(1402)-N(4))-methyltransferase RsmH [Crocinitomicaceae bacterium]MDG2463806.1 16S rRNA (cytosine(1402)-N(4))-methyltransferase RsmH [Crocinitomicaceae bacterium]